MVAQLKIDENKTKKEKPIALKATASDSSDQESQSEEEEEIIFRTFFDSVNNLLREYKAVVTLVNLVNIFETISFRSI